MRAPLLHTLLSTNRPMPAHTPARTSKKRLLSSVNR
nr:MAG TPA: hypothetical protein [Caudoviricetes sp.]